ncbi:hypothetical protein [Chelativorans sp. Marseille-P2723]|uniref:hypothetical protein n=1 Tax=Chelativorans sp. Marseille-P2723 TaxID=2709133 RepID=UPI001570E9A2|nr:hypothetical protein [Chelativorans sp. Marseille-P2723]
MARWKASLVSSIPVCGLVARNPDAYKWKGLFRVWVVRKAALWRMHDLMAQSYSPQQMGDGLGARILLRSGLKTLGVLIYLNLIIKEIIDRKLNFHVFSERTVRLLGSHNDPDWPRWHG